MRGSGHACSGAVLLEVIVGMAFLTIVSSSWIALLRQTAHSVRELQQREGLTRAASAELRRITLWPRGQLEARAGSSRLSVFTLTVVQQSPSLFAIALRDTSSGVALARDDSERPWEGDAAFPRGGPDVVAVRLLRVDEMRRAADDEESKGISS